MNKETKLNKLTNIPFIVCAFDRLDAPEAWSAPRTHTHTHTCANTRTHTHTHTHARANTRTRAQTHAHARKHTHTRTLTHAHSHARMHTHFSLRNSVSRVDCTSNISLSNMSSNLVTVKTAFYNNRQTIDLILTFSFGQGGTNARCCEEKEVVQEETAIILRS